MAGLLRGALIGFVLLAAATTVDARPGHPWSRTPTPPGASPDASTDLFALLEPKRRARIEEIVPDIPTACAPAGSNLTDTPDRAELVRATAVIGKSPVGAWLLEQATWRLVVLCLDPSTDLAAYYRAGMRLIGVLASLPSPAQTMFLAHELAHVVQHPWFSNNRRFGAEAMILMHRVREAAAEAIATRILWQLDQRGHAAPWQHKLTTGYADIARAFAARMAASDGAVDAELRATRAAFDQWFARPRRVAAYDAHMLDHIERIADDRIGLVAPTRTLSDRYLRGIGWHAGETFLPEGAARPLTDAFYAGRLSEDNAQRLRDALARPREPSLARVPTR